MGEEIKVGHPNLRQADRVKFRQEKEEVGGEQFQDEEEEGERGRRQTHNGMR